MRRSSIFMMAEGGGAGGGGAGAPDWRSTLPEDLRGEAMFKDIPDVPTLAKVARDSKAALGGSIRPPGPEAGPEARKEFIAKLQKHAPELVLVPEDDKARAEVEESILGRFGVSKDAQRYAAPKDVEIPEQHLAALRAEAVEEGWTKRTFEARAKRVAAALDQATKAQAETRAALKRELGAAYDERIDAVAASVAKLGFPEELVKAVRAGTVDLGTFKALSAVAKGFGEAREVAGQGAGASGRLTPAEAKLQRAELRARKEFWDRSVNPGLTDQLRKKDLDLAELEFAQ
jgi:hypothetical protein